MAVGPRDGPEARLIAAYAEALAERRRDIRLRVVAFDDVKSSAAALEQNKTILAVLRPDVLLPVNGSTVAILREEALIVVALPSENHRARPDARPRAGLLFDAPGGIRCGMDEQKSEGPHSLRSRVRGPRHTDF